MGASKFRLLVWAYYVALSGLWLLLLVTHINDSTLRTVAAEHLRMAYNLANNGVISGDKNDPPSTATMKREPIPILTLAAWISADTKTRNQPYGELLQGEALKSLKTINLVWSFFILIGICTIVFLV